MACLIPTFNANSITLLTTKASTCAIYFTWEGGICWVREAMTRPWSFQILPNPYFVLLENNCPIEVNLETVLADEHEGTFSKIGRIKLYPSNRGLTRHSTCERPPKLGVPLKKEIWVLFRAPLFLGKCYGVATYFFIQK